MNWFLTCFRLGILQRMRNAKSWFLLLMLPLLMFGLSTFLPEEQVSAPVLVGVALPDDEAEELWSLLEARSGNVLTFIRTDADTIDRNVAAGRWDCGVIIAEDFTQRLEELDTDRLFTLRVGKGSAVYPLVQETVSSCMAVLSTRPIAEKYLTDSGILENSVLGSVRSQLEQPLGEDERILISMRTADGEPLSPFNLTNSGIRKILQWVISAAILIWLLLCTSDLGRWSAQGAVKRLMPLRSATSLMCAQLAADSLTALIAGCVSMFILGDGFFGCLAVAAYVLFLSGVGVLIAHFPGIWQSIPVLPPFLVAASLLLSGAMVDISVFIPSAALLTRLAPGSLFLNICQGQWLYSLPLIITSAVFLFLSAILDKFKKRCAK